MEHGADAGSSRGANVIAASVTMFVAATLAAGLRLHTRVKFLGGLKVEDYLIVGAWVSRLQPLVVCLPPGRKLIPFQGLLAWCDNCSHPA